MRKNYVFLLLMLLGTFFDISAQQTITLSQNSDTSISGVGQFLCTNKGNSWMRNFELSSFNVTGDITINSVDIGVSKNDLTESGTGLTTQTVNVRILSADASYPSGTPQVLGEEQFQLGIYPNDSNTIVNFAFTTPVVVSSTVSHVVVEFSIPDAGQGNFHPWHFVIGQSSEDTTDAFVNGECLGFIDTPSNHFGGSDFNYYIVANATGSASAPPVSLTEVWSDDFTNGIPSWTLTDSDQDGLNWEIFDFEPAGVGFGSSEAYSSIRSKSYDDNTNSALNPNNWIVSEAIDLSNASGMIELSWDAKASDATYDSENYSVYVATSSDIATLESASLTSSHSLSGVNDFTGKTLDISSLTGEGAIYIAFRHHNSSNESAVEITDVKVSAETISTPTPPVLTEVWSDDFTNGISSWTLTDSDQDGLNWEIFDFVPAGVGIGFGSGEAYSSIRSKSFDDNTNTTLNPNNWIVSEAIDLSNASGMIELSWDAKVSDATYDSENYSVYVATSSDIATLESASLTSSHSLSGVTEFTGKTLDISSLTGEGAIYIAFRHHNSSDNSAVEITDVKVSAETISTPVDPSLVWSEDFENGISAWTLYDEDNDTNNWQILDYGTSSKNVSGKVVESKSYDGSPLNPDNYLVSAAIDLSAETTDNNLILKWNVRAGDTSYDDEVLTVYVATANDVTTLTASQTSASENLKELNSDVLVERTLDISSFIGESTVYVAFRHHNASDGDRIELDDLSIVREEANGEPTPDVVELIQTPVVTTITSAVGQQCNNTEMGYARHFDISNQGVNGAFQVEKVDFGMFRNDEVMNDVWVRVWKSNATNYPSPTLDNANLIGEEQFTLPEINKNGTAGVGEVVTFTLQNPIQVPSDVTHIMIEVNFKNSGATYFQMGSISNETAEGYVLVGCDPTFSAQGYVPTSAVFGGVGAKTAGQMYYIVAKGVESTLSNDEVVLGDKDVKIYPNPTSKIVNIQLMADNTVNKVSAYNLLGKEVNVRLHNNQVDLSSLNTGIYILKVQTDRGVISKRIVKM